MFYRAGKQQISIENVMHLVMHEAGIRSMPGE